MKILVIRFLAIGDVIISTTICRSLKRSFPSAQIDYLVHSVSAPLLLNHPDIDNVIALSLEQRKNPLKYFKAIRTIAKTGYDIIIDATSTPKSEFVSLLSRRSKYKIGRFKKHRGFAYTHKIMPAELQGDKFSQRLAMLKPLQDDGLLIESVSDMRLYVTESERNQMKSVMQTAGVDFERPVFAFSVSSKLDEKRWNDDYMQRIAEYCLDRYKAQIIFFAGMPHEQAQIQLMRDKMASSRTHTDNSDVFANIAAPSLRDLIALFVNCDLFIGNEGGPRHMAHAVGLPTVCVFSPFAERQEWLPRGSDRHQAIEWRDLPEFQGKEINYQTGDSEYYRLYNSIKPEHITPLIDDVIAKHLTHLSRETQ